MAKEKIKAALAAIIQNSLQAFLVRAFSTLHPGQELVIAQYLRVISHALERVERGEIKRLAIALPPRHLKSVITSICFTAWVLGRDPTRRIICASYGQSLSLDFSLKTRNIMQSDWYQQLFPATHLDKTKLTQDEIRTTAQGFRLATSVGGALTGKGGDILVVDDPLKADDSHAEGPREAVWNWFTSTLMTRLNDPKTGAVVVVSQRLHEDDLIGRLKEQGGWHILELPAIATIQHKVPIGDDLFWVREPEELLNPDWMGKAELDQIRKELGPSAFEAQYQQRPVPPGGNLFKLEWFSWYETKLPLHHFEAIVESWDTAAVPGETNDYSVCTVWGIKGKRLYLLDVFRKRLNYPSLKQATLALKEKYSASLVVVEAASSGHSLWQDLRNMKHTWIKSLGVEKGKVHRGSQQSAKIADGQVYLPKESPWLEKFVAEVAAFPNGKYDDQVDSMTLFLRALDHTPYEIHEISYFKKKD